MALLELTSTQLDIFDFARHFDMDSIGSEAVESVLSDLKPLLGSALVIGGLAVNYHGYKRYTDDADILYAEADAAIFKRLSKKFKLVKKGKSGWHRYEHKATKVRLELIPEGGLTTYGFIPGPQFFGSDNGFLPLLGVIWLKLVAGRIKDDADIAELAKRRLNEVVATRAKLPTELLERFDAIIARVEREMKSDPNEE